MNLYIHCSLMIAGHQNKATTNASARPASKVHWSNPSVQPDRERRWRGGVIQRPLASSATGRTERYCAVLDVRRVLEAGDEEYGWVGGGRVVKRTVYVDLCRGLWAWRAFHYYSVYAENSRLFQT